MSAEKFWARCEMELGDYDDLARAIDDVFTRWEKERVTFAWRGQVDASWPLHSSLYRRLMWTSGSAIGEMELYETEGKTLADVHRWGLHVADTSARLSVLSQLAALQHYGAPTRLVDVTFNPWIAAWFAVQQRWKNGKAVGAGVPARLFAIDVTDRLINEQAGYRSWEDGLSRPWPKPSSPIALRRRWTTQVFAWRPARFDARIAAQNGGFLFGGVPQSTQENGRPVQWDKGGGRWWTIEEVRGATSLALHPHKFGATRGAVRRGAVYSFRIAEGAKRAIRRRLERNFGYTYATLYPDFTGFAIHGVPKLKSAP